MKVEIALGAVLLGVALGFHSPTDANAAVDDPAPISAGRPCAVLDGDEKGMPDRYLPLPPMNTSCPFTDGDREHIAGVTIGGSVTIDLGELHRIHSVVLHGCQYCFVQTAETNADNASYARFGTPGQLDHSDPSYVRDPSPATVVHPVPVQARYVRVTDLGTGPKIREIEVFGSGPIIATTTTAFASPAAAVNPLTTARSRRNFGYPIALVVVAMVAALLTIGYAQLRRRAPES